MRRTSRLPALLGIGGRECELIDGEMDAWKFLFKLSVSGTSDELELVDAADEFESVLWKLLLDTPRLSRGKVRSFVHDMDVALCIIDIQIGGY